MKVSNFILVCVSCGAEEYRCVKTENSLLENNEEQILTSDIERDLADVRLL